MAYCLVQTSPDADRGAKELVLRRFCDQLKRRGVNPEFTLSDKDWAEINAMRAVWPNAKHQLCFWHALRAVKQRLCKASEMPGDYDWNEPHREFSFVNPLFVPVAKQQFPHQVKHHDVQHNTLINLIYTFVSRSLYPPTHQNFGLLYYGMAAQLPSPLHYLKSAFPRQALGESGSRIQRNRQMRKMPLTQRGVMMRSSGERRANLC